MRRRFFQLTILITSFVLCAPNVALAASLPSGAAHTTLLAGPVAQTQNIQLTATAAETPASKPAAEPGVRLVKSDENGLVLELATPDFKIERGESDNGPCDLVSVVGYGESGAPGWPRLPATGALVGIPPQARPTITILEAKQAPVAKRYNLCPAPQYIFDIEHPLEEPRLPNLVAVQDATAYSTNEFYPAELAQIVSVGKVRSQSVAQLRFNPFQYNAVSGELHYFQYIRVKLEFAQPKNTLALNIEPVPDEGAFEDVLSQMLVNYGEARQWRDRSSDLGESREITGNSVKLLANQPGYKLLVEQDGLYQVTYAELQTAGMGLGGVDPHTLQLFNQGQQVAIWVEGEADGSFDANDVILFYGQRLNTKHSDTNVYWLTWGITNGLRMASVDGAPGSAAPIPASFWTTMHMETDQWYQSNYPSGSNRDHWYWDLVLSTGSPVSRDYVTTLRPVTAPYSATVRGLLRGYSALTQHHTQIYLNGHLIEDAVWAAASEHPFAKTIPSPYLAEGENTITVVAGIGNSRDYVWVNWFEIDYGAAYSTTRDLFVFDGDQAGVWDYRVNGFTTSTLELLDVTMPSSPARILNAAIQPSGGGYDLTFQHAITSEHRYIALSLAQRLSPLRIERNAPSNLRSSANEADYIIITHADFYTAAQSLAAFRTAQGLRSAVVDVQDIYDEFSYGIYDPESIRSFLGYAYASWMSPAPAYVVLMGDGNYDPKNIYNRGEPSYIPPYLAEVDYWMGETAADNRYVCVSGVDVFPDMHLGRLPVKTSVEASALVAKIVDYEQNPAPGDWNQQVLFVADNPDNAGDFYYYSDVIADYYLPAPYTAQKVYYGRTHTDPTQARNTIISAINEGRLIVNYSGHGSTTGWASENLFRASNISTLANAGKLPLVVSMACLNGYFITPSPSSADYSSMAETFVRTAGKGAIASWSGTGLGLAYDHDFMNRGLFQAIFSNGVVELGPATTLGKLYLYSRTGGGRDQIDEYTLFGDPALRLNVLRADVGITQTVIAPNLPRPGDTITYTLAYSNAGPATAHHVVINAALPDALLNPTVASSGAAVTLHAGSRLVWDVEDLVAGAGGLITVTTFIDPVFVGVFTNIASIATSDVESDEANNTTGPVATTIYVPDLAIDLQSPSVAQAGALVTYTLVYSNIGEAVADGVVISHPLPLNLLNIAVTHTGAGVTAHPGQSFAWDVTDLAQGEGGIITISARVDPAAVGVLVNTANIVGGRLETNPDNNIAEPIVTQILAYDLAIALSGPSTAQAGALVTYTLTYTNSGDAAATGVVITDNLPTTLTNISFDYAGAVARPRAGTSFVWDIADLDTGEGGVITIVATVNATFAGTFANKALIAGAGAESNVQNNASELVSTYVGIPDLAIALRGPFRVKPGSQVVYTLKYANIGDAPAYRVVISDVLPIELVNASFVHKDSGITLKPGTRFVWTVARLAPGEEGVIIIIATIRPRFRGIIYNAASIGSASFEKERANNTALTRVIVGGHYEILAAFK